MLKCLLCTQMSREDIKTSKHVFSSTNKMLQCYRWMLCLLRSWAQSLGGRQCNSAANTFICVHSNFALPKDGQNVSSFCLCSFGPQNICVFICHEKYSMIATWDPLINILCFGIGEIVPKQRKGGLLSAISMC